MLGSDSIARSEDFRLFLTEENADGEEILNELAREDGGASAAAQVPILVIIV